MPDQPTPWVHVNRPTQSAQCPFVAEGAVGDWLLLVSIGGSKEEPRPAACQPLTWPLIRDCGTVEDAKPRLRGRSLFGESASKRRLARGSLQRAVLAPPWRAAALLGVAFVPRAARSGLVLSKGSASQSVAQSLSREVPRSVVLVAARRDVPVEGGLTDSRFGSDLPHR
jgi:hypothetical protein